MKVRKKTDGKGMNTKFSKKKLFVLPRSVIYHSINFPFSLLKFSLLDITTFIDETNELLLVFYIRILTYDTETNSIHKSFINSFHNSTKSELRALLRTHNYLIA